MSLSCVSNTVVGGHLPWRNMRTETYRTLGWKRCRCLKQTASHFCTGKFSLGRGFLGRDGDNIGLVSGQDVAVAFRWQGPQVT